MGEFVLHIPCFFLFFLIWGVTLTHPSIAFFFFGSFSYKSHAGFFSPSFLSFFSFREFLLHIPWWLHFYLGCFSYTFGTAFFFFFFFFSFFIWGVSLTHSMLVLFFCGEFHLHIPCWLHFYLGSFSYTSRAGFNYISALSLTHPRLASFFSSGSFSYTSRAGFIFIWGVCLTHPMLALFFCGEFLLLIPCWLFFK